MWERRKGKEIEEIEKEEEEEEMKKRGEDMLWIGTSKEKGLERTTFTSTISFWTHIIPVFAFLSFS